MIRFLFIIAVVFQSPLRFGVNKARLNLHGEAGDGRAYDGADCPSGVKEKRNSKPKGSPQVRASA